MRKDVAICVVSFGLMAAGLMALPLFEKPPLIEDPMAVEAGLFSAAQAAQ